MEEITIRQTIVAEIEATVVGDEINLTIAPTAPLEIVVSMTTPGPKGEPFTYEDFTEEQLLGLVGPQGPQGEQGPVGATGAKGDQGEVGPRGLQGIQGIQGEPGPQGEIGPTGPQGATGATGPQGPQGIKGDVGAQGPQGDTGLTGPQGIQGEQGPAGPKGDDGIQGPQGTQGPKGDPFVYADFTPEQLLALTGPQGEQGPIGDAGPQGPQGIKGDTGLTGATGPQGEQGLQGIQGEVGPQGPKGDTGDQGIQGLQGPKGDAGDIGPQGIQGPAGNDGAQGPQGIQGIQGPAGADGTIIPNKSKMLVLESDFFNASVNALPGVLGVAISSGTVGVVASDANHLGVMSISDSTTANGGYRFLTDVSAFRIAGGEICEFVFKPVSVRSTASFRLGFQDSTAIQTAPTDGVFVDIVGNATNPILTAKTRSNSTQSASASPYTLTANTWYCVRITVNSSATSVLFELFSESGSSLWSDTLTTNIPTASGREVGWGVIAGETSTDAAAVIVQLDYVSLYINRTLTR